jgi:hypothetical protein
MWGGTSQSTGLRPSMEKRPVRGAFFCLSEKPKIPIKIFEPFFAKIIAFCRAICYNAIDFCIQENPFIRKESMTEKKWKKSLS